MAMNTKDIFSVDDRSWSQSPLLSTTAYRVVTLRRQIEVCTQIVDRVNELDKLNDECKRAEEALQADEQRAKVAWRRRINAAEKEVNAAESQVEKATRHYQHCVAALQEYESRRKQLSQRNWTSDDLRRINRAIQTACESVDKKLAQLKQDRTRLVQRLTEQKNRLEQLQNERHILHAEALQWQSGMAPERVANILRQKEEQAKNKHADRVVALQTQLNKLCARRKIVQSLIPVVRERVDTLQRKVAEQELEAKRSAIKWLLISIVRTLIDDAKKKLRAAEREAAALESEESELTDQIRALDDDLQRLVAQRNEFIDSEVAEERSRQYAAFLQKQQQVETQWCQCRKEITDAQERLHVIDQDTEGLQKIRDQYEREARDDAQQAIIDECEKLLRDAQQALVQADAEQQQASQQRSAAQAELEQLRQQEASFLTQQLEKPQCALAAARRARDELEQQIRARLAAAGVAVPESLSAKTLKSLCAALSRELQLHLASNLPRSPSPIVIASSSHASAQPAIPPAEGILYLDFDRNAESTCDPTSQRFRSLQEQLVELYRRYRGALFPQHSNETTLLDLFRAEFFPDGFQLSFLAANISFNQDYPYLLIRPKVIGPRLEALLPRGVTLAVCGRLWDNRQDPDNPVLLVQRIIDLSHCSARPFERELQVQVRTSDIYPRASRQDNVLTQQFVRSLPEITVRTKRQLQEWRAYLDWKEHLVRTKMTGVRYVGVRLDLKEANAQIHFLVVAESAEAFRQASRIFRKDSLHAFALECSHDPWKFQFREDQRADNVELGDYLRTEVIASPPPQFSQVKVPWPDPHWAWVIMRLSENMQADFERARDAHVPTPEIERTLLGQIPAAGFLSLSVVGDLAVIERQRRSLDQLEQQSGFAPMLSSYLFDVSAALQPVEIIDIPQHEWFRKDLNEDQKLAVRKMLSAPDLALVQGPPGTGKTTAIAEAIGQFVRRGRTVLLASQANLAVDNALERLTFSSQIRAIRLGRRGEETCPYSQSQALVTYYQAIATSCFRDIIHPWQQADSLEKALNRLLHDADLLYQDWQDLRTQHDTLRQNLADISRQIHNLEVEKSRIEQAKAECAALAGFVDFLRHDADWWGELPPQLTNSFDEIIRPALHQLREVGIDLDSDPGAAVIRTNVETSQRVISILRRWRQLCDDVPRMQSELERLEKSNSDTILTDEDEKRLHELIALADQLSRDMASDPQKIAEWRTTQKEIKAIRQHRSGMDVDLYRRVFNAERNGELVYVRLTRSDAKRIEVLEQLRNAINTVTQYQSLFESARQQCCDLAFEIMSGLTPNDPVEEQLKQLKVQRNDWEDRFASLSNDIRAKEERLLEILRQYPAPVDTSFSDMVYSKFRQAVQDRLMHVQAFRDEQREFREAWEPILTEWANNLSDPATAHRDQNTFLPIYLDACNVVGITCTESPRTLESAGHVRFDVAIIDEVSKATPPELLFPMLMARTSILVGDHRQLPPLFRETELSWEEALTDQEVENDLQEQAESPALTRENFERFKKLVTASFFKEHFENAPDNLKATLVTQYRMHPQIMDVVNHFYEKQLRCGLPDPDGLNPLSDSRGHRLHGITLYGPNNQSYLEPNHHVLWIDSSEDPLKCSHYEERSASGGKLNELEAILVAQCLCDLERACYALGYGNNGRPPKRVGVITFYARQVGKIREALRHIQRFHNITFRAIRVDVNTVDRYQGRERPIVLVSLVRNPRGRLSNRANTAQFERINVAFSRAQELLIILGAKNAFNNYSVRLPHLTRPGYHNVTVYRYIIEQITRSGCFRTAAEILDPHVFQRLSSRRCPAPVRQR